MKHDLDFSDLSSLEGRNVHLSVDLGFILRHTSVGADEFAGFSEMLVDALRQRVGQKHSLMISAYNYDFGKDRFFSAMESPSHVGRFSNLLLKHPDVVRTVIPFFSFLVLGTHQKKLNPYPYLRSTGAESPFDFQVRENYLLLAIGHHASKALTIIHHAEDLARVAWRKTIWREGTVEAMDGTTQHLRVQFLARKSGVEFSGLTLLGDRLMRKNGVIGRRRILVNGSSVPCELVELSALTDELVTSLSTGSVGLVAPILLGDVLSQVISPRVADNLFMERLEEDHESVCPVSLVD